MRTGPPPADRAFERVLVSHGRVSPDVVNVEERDCAVASDGGARDAQSQYRGASLNRC